MEIFNHITFKSKIDSVITKDLVGLTGFVFNYDKDSGVNKSLFSNYLELNHTDLTNPIAFAKAAQNKLFQKREEFLSLQQDLEGSGENELGDAFLYYKDNFHKIKIFFDLLELYIPIEVSKIGAFYEKSNFLFEELSREVLLEKIDRLEDCIFGNKLSQRMEYSEIVLKYMRKLQQDKQKELSQDDAQFLENILNSIESHIGVNLNDINTFQRDKINQYNEKIALKDPLLGIDGLDDSILDKKVLRENYIKIFELAISILGLDGMTVKVKDDITNFSVNSKSINVPSNGDYADIAVKRIIEIISHELERHAIGNVNNESIIGNLKSLSYLGQEEGVAHVLENLAMGKDLNSIPLNRYMPRILVGELFDGVTFKRFLGIMNILDGQNMNVDAFFIRFKRGRDFELPGVNPKEKLYGIGALEIITRIQNGENPLGFYLAKNGSSEQEIITEIVTGKQNGKLTPQLLEEKRIILPLMLGELLRFSLISPEKKGKGLAISGFLKYFNDRYGALFEKLGINYKDFITTYIRSNKRKNVKKVSQILEIIHE